MWKSWNETGCNFYKLGILDLTKCSLADVCSGGPTQNELRVICQFLGGEQNLMISFHIKSYPIIKIYYT